MYNLLRFSQSFLLVSFLVAAGHLIAASSAIANSSVANEDSTEAAIAPETEFKIANFESIDEPIYQPTADLQSGLQDSYVAPAAGQPSIELAESTIAQSITQPTVAPVNSQPEAEVFANPSAGLQEMNQLTSVSQLSDVQPTDWAFQALQSLVERYGVIAGYPDGTFRGNRALTRYEFAAGLNAALDRVNELIAAGLAETVTQEDLATLQRLQEEFAAELATLRGRVDVLEAQTAELEANQFSTTTVLNGEVIFGLISVIDGNNANDEPIDRNPTFGYRVRLNLETSFTGEDQLTTRFQANNITPLGGTNEGVLQTNEGRVEFDGDSDDQFQLGLLRYRFPVGDRTNIYLAATGNGFVDLDASAQLTPYLDGSAVSLFALRNPIYNYSAGAGFGLRHFLTDDIEINLGYLVPDAGNPEPGSGLFNGKYSALAQAIFYGFDQRLRVGFSYINSYTPSGEFFGLATGSNLANEKL
ncbi:MAG: iron uptake porin [Leptolyngbyaceae cyanobacterium RM2_2_4]|nr:iron uptake porin [Leptolyngbyaceae cyanobacterium RM2_2_4]